MSPRIELCAAISSIHSKGWAAGTGGNFSCVINRSPLTLLMAPSGVDKGQVTPEALIEVNEHGVCIKGEGKVSAEGALHIAIAKKTGAGAILHTHSVYNTVLSHRHVANGSLSISGFEMLKGLAGNTTHETEEIVPILPNSQDMNLLSKSVEAILESQKSVKGILLAGHGLYTWGDDIFSARRHVEAFEFLFNVVYHLNG